MAPGFLHIGISHLGAYYSPLCIRPPLVRQLAFKDFRERLLPRPVKGARRLSVAPHEIHQPIR